MFLNSFIKKSCTHDKFIDSINTNYLTIIKKKKKKKYVLKELHNWF
jgi:hypothetical protein